MQGVTRLAASGAACKCVRVMAFELEVISEGKHADLLMTIRDSLSFQFHLHSKAERKERVCLYLELHKDRTRPPAPAPRCSGVAAAAAATASVTSSIRPCTAKVSRPQPQGRQGL